MAINTTDKEEAILSQCYKFGGLAKECHDIVVKLDYELEKAKEKIKELEEEIEDLNKPLL